VPCVCASAVVACAAFVVLLVVRIVNRRERWAKWTLAGVIGVPVLYVLSFGPACLMCENGILGQRTAWLAFRPLTWLANQRRSVVSHVLCTYAKAWGDRRRMYDVI